jgi:hypothetical protein
VRLQVVVADATQNGDLLWAARGAGGGDTMIVTVVWGGGAERCKLRAITGPLAALCAGPPWRDAQVFIAEVTYVYCVDYHAGAELAGFAPQNMWLMRERKEFERRRPAPHP